MLYMTLIVLVRTKWYGLLYTTFFENLKWLRIQNGEFGYFAKIPMAEYSAQFELRPITVSGLSKVLYSRNK